MKERLQGLMAGVLIGAICAGGTALAKTGKETIEVSYQNIKIFMDGEEVDARDANGNKVEPFIYNGTTYLPVRAVGQVVGKEVSWDGVEKVVYLGAKPGNVENWLDVCGPYQFKRGENFKLVDNKYFTMSGRKYTNGFVLQPSGTSTGSNKAEAMFNLNGEFKSISFSVGHIDDTSLNNATMNIYIDGIVEYTMDLKYDDVARKVTIPLDGALQMKIEIIGTDYHNSADWGFSEGKFE